MSLKRQLFVASLLMLLIPWAGLQFVLELDTALREQSTSQLNAQASRMALALANQLPVMDSRETLYATTLSRALNIDGYGDDWPGYDDTDTPTETTNEPIQWQAAVHGSSLYLLIRVQVESPVYFDPGQPNRPFEHLRMYWQSGEGLHERHIRTPAPGPVVGWRPGREPAADYRITGVWQATGRGYQLELQLPRLEENSLFSFAVHRPVPEGAGVEPGTTRPVAGPAINPRMLRLVTRLPRLEENLAASLVPGQHVRILTPEGWILADSHIPATKVQTDFEAMSPLEIVEQISLNGLRALVRYFQPLPLQLPETEARITPGQLGEQAIVRHGEADAQLMVAHDLPAGHVLMLEQSLEQILALSGNTLGSVITRSTLLILGLMLVLLGYASWLSWRIARLQRAVRASVDDDGRIIAAMPPSKARDELGDLSRQFSLMVDNLQGYTRYLESFARRLSHELKTPVAVVRSSLENLSHDTRPEQQAIYIHRAHQATDRLSQILQGMSEAARLEQSFDQAEKEVFDLAIVAAQAAEAYQELSPQHRIRYVGPANGCTLNGSPELLVQLLDKLVDNARDFTPHQGRIEVELKHQGGGLELSVFNEGSSLPTDLAGEIFSPFVSIRDGTDQGHLGQGLLIVRLIAEYHGGAVQAFNDTASGGVRFRVTLPENGRS
ncbi:MAG: ATP-binding protein [Marinobacter sp.]|uniref:ATP-binding protein n=1 Tax=Marinobacter sp. TaxID=50741 RepID=UPI0034A0A32E